MIDAPECTIEKDQIFLMYALVQSGVAIAAFDEAERMAVTREVRADADDDTPTMVKMEAGNYFASVRAALQASANVSKTFWPSMAGPGAQRAIRSARGERLRKLTNLPDSHPLGDRSLRNHIEHLDERLDEWTDQPRPTFLGVELAWPQELNTMPAVNRQAAWNASPIIYDWATHKVHLFGQEFSMVDLRAQILDVQNHISAALVA